MDAFAKQLSDPQHVHIRFRDGTYFVHRDDGVFPPSPYVGTKVRFTRMAAERILTVDALGSKLYRGAVMEPVQDGLNRIMQTHAANHEPPQSWYDENMDGLYVAKGASI